MVRFLLVVPKPPWDADFAGLQGEDGLTVTRVAPIAMTTIAAMAPAGIELVLHDESLGPLDVDAPADFVGITANVSQARRALEIAKAFRERGKKVIIGGPHITLDPQAFADACDVKVTGELEGVAAEFYADMLAGAMKAHYDGGRPDLTTSPIPAWELFDNDRALMGVVQTSRGCPFQCNFCDVIQYVGRAQRHKTAGQVLAEVQRLYALGYNQIQLADDNFTVYRRRAAALLEALAAWNGHDGRGYVTFNTQVSLDITRDEHMLALCADAGLHSVFIGIETVNQESLRASGKRQNLVSNTTERVRTVLAHGIDVMAGLMVGFDADDRSIFQRQYDFAMTLPVSTFKVSSLNAPTATPLYAEMQAAGRLVGTEDAASYPSADLVTNILPAQMSREELVVGTRWLISRLFRPEAFLERLEAAAAILGPNPLAARARPYEPPGRRLSRRLLLRMMARLGRQDASIARAINRASELMRCRPGIAHGVNLMVTTWLLSLNGHLERGTYDPAWGRLSKPPFANWRSAA